MLTLELLLEKSDGAVPGVGVGLAAFVVGGEGGGAVVEELLLPGGEEVDGDAEFFADVGDGDFLDEGEPEGGDLLRRGVVAALSGQGYSSARVLPLAPAKANSRSDWGNTHRPRHRRAGRAVGPAIWSSPRAISQGGQVWRRL